MTKRHVNKPEYPGKPGPDGPSKYTPEYIADMGQKLLAFAKRPPRKETFSGEELWVDLSIGDFIIEQKDEKITYARIGEWCDVNEEFSKLYKQAHRLIGKKREQLGLNKTIDAGFVQKTQAIYDPEYKDLLRWLKESEQNISKSMGAIKEFITMCKDKKEEK